MFDNIRIAASRSGLTPEQEAENYATFQKLMDSGVLLSDLVRRAETPQTPPEVFTAMESAVADDPSVASARDAVARERTRVLEALCMRDTGYSGAVTAYRRAVADAYTKRGKPSESAESAEPR